MSGNVIHLENGRLAADTPFPHVEQLLTNAVTQAGPGGVVIHFHGGLVNEAAGRRIAARLTPIYEAAGAFPIFPVWEAGLTETIANNLGQISREELFRIVLKHVRRIVGRKFAQGEGARGGTLPSIDFSESESAITNALDNDDLTLLPPDPQPPAVLTRLSDAERVMVEAELQADPGLLLAAEAVSRGMRTPSDIAADESARSLLPVVASTSTLMDPAAVERLVEERPDAAARGIFTAVRASKAVVGIAARVIRRYIADRDHGLHATVVEEILREFYFSNVGGRIWSQMKQDTADSFGPDAELFGGTAMLSVLSASVQGGAEPRVTLIGHSTGSVYISHFLAAAENTLPTGVKFDVVLLAPASTFDLMGETLDRHRLRIGSFRMFTMDDSRERADKLVPVLYPHSLLYFVSGVVESNADTPIVGMERYYDADQYEPGEFPNVEIVRRFVQEKSTRAVWSVSTNAGNGLRSGAVSHGDFDNDEETLKSVQHALSQGF